MRQLSALAGVSTRTLYDLFAEGKQECLLSTYDAAMRRLARRVALAYISEHRWERRLARAVDAFACEVRDEPAVARLVLVEVFAAGPGALERMEHAHSLFEGMINLSFRQTAAGEPPPLVVKGVVAGLARVARARLLDGRAVELPGVHRGAAGVGAVLPLAGCCRGPKPWERWRADRARGRQRSRARGRERAHPGRCGQSRRTVRVFRAQPGEDRGRGGPPTQALPRALQERAAMFHGGIRAADQPRAGPCGGGRGARRELARRCAPCGVRAVPVSGGRSERRAAGVYRGAGARSGTGCARERAS